MRDRTLIILAVLFLTFSIGSGVNKSLEAGNRTMGRPMAPGLKQLYNSNVPLTKILVSSEIKTKTELLQDKFEKAYNKVKSKILDKKNMTVR